MSRIVRLALLAAALVVLLALPGSALAAAGPAWLEPENVSAVGGESSLPEVAFNAQGDLAAAWVAHEGGHTVIQAATRPAGGSWSAAQRISATSPSAQGAKVGVDAAGDVTVVWEQGEGETFVIYGADLPAGGSWSTPHAISDVAGNSRVPALAVSSAGEATVLWSEEEGHSSRTRIRSSWRSGGGSWTTPTWLDSATGPEWGPQLAVAADGTVTAAWEGSNQIDTATRPEGGGWSAVAVLLPNTSAESFASSPSLAVASTGAAVIAWRDEIEEEGNVIEGAVRPAGGSWSAVARLSSIGGDPFAPQVGIDKAGNATAVWRMKSGGQWVIEAAEAPAGGSWTSPAQISTPGVHAFFPDLAVTPDGEAVAAWERSDGTNTRIETAVHPAGGAWAAPTIHSQAGANAEHPALAADGVGDMALAWERFQAGKPYIQVAGYDAGPQLGGLSIPATATAGQPAAFSVSPVGVWLPASAVSWEFGDGETAAGTNVSHTYNGGGAYQVTVTASDSGGAARSASGEVTVSGAGKEEPVEWAPDQPLAGFAVQGKVEAIARSGERVYIGGEFGFVGQPARGAVTIDPETGEATAPAFETDAGIFSATPDGSGGTYVGGEFRRILGGRRSHLAHVLPGGELDRDFTIQADGNITALARSGSTLFVAGSFTHIGGQTRPHLASINLNTEEVTSWNPAPNGNVNSLAVSGANVYVGGPFTNVGGVPRNHLAAIELASNTPTAWAPEPNGSVNTIVADEYAVYVGGSFTEFEGRSQARLASYDTLDEEPTAWSPAPNGDVSSLALTGNVVYVGGSFSEIGGRARTRLAAVRRGGNGEATSFHPPGPASAPASLDVDGSTLYATGSFTKVGGEARTRLAAFDTVSGLLRAWNPGLGATGDVILARGSGVLVGGVFQTACGEPRQNLAALDSSTSQLLPWNPGADGRVQALATDGTTVYATGEFANAGGLERSGPVALDALTGAGDPGWDPEPNGSVSALLVHGSNLYMGGSFTEVSGVPRHRIAVFRTSDGVLTGWSTDVSGPVTSLAISGTDLVIGGNFASVGGVPHSRVAAVELGTGGPLPWSVGVDATVQAVAADAETIYIAGIFDHVGGAEHRTVAAIDKATGEVEDWNPGIEGNGTSLALAGSVLYVGTATELVGVDAASGNLTAWEPDMERLLGGVRALLSSGSTVYVGGNFFGFGGRAHEGFAAFGQGPPTNVVVPSVTGAALAGHQLLCSPGSWSGKVTGYTRQWLRGGLEIAGETGAEYNVLAGDVGKELACRVVARNDTGSATATSAAVAVPAEGERGATGEPGAAGERGATGERGERGETGGAGARGEAGAQGEPGAAGATGTAGATGATGTAGANGATGANGAAGAAGAAGAMGPEGSAGSSAKVTCQKQGAKFRCTVTYRAAQTAKVAVLRGGKVIAKGTARVQSGRATFKFTVPHGTYQLESTERGANLVTQIWIHV
ncbi:MAG: PKD domain-containing protein [Actinobacteria bacterium]|nr:PKD domain-containing protein [Actinomycetota bacterium]